MQKAGFLTTRLNYFKSGVYRGIHFFLSLLNEAVLTCTQNNQNILSEIYRFYNREKLPYIARACYRKVGYPGRKRITDFETAKANKCRLLSVSALSIRRKSAVQAANQCFPISALLLASGL